jgi:pSer/pThr/pTyr-binding forkhead associated (FHA) protein
VRPSERPEQHVLRVVRLPPRRRRCACRGAGRRARAGCRAGRRRRRHVAHRAESRRYRGWRLPAAWRRDDHRARDRRHLRGRQLPIAAPRDVKDEGSLNGVYKKLARDVPVELRPNDIFRIGQEIIKFEPLTPQAASPDGVERLGAPSKGYIGRIALVIGREETGNAFPIPEGGVHLGRERGDILFPEDGYVSGLHCRLSWDGQRLHLTDLGSSNGTFLRISAETEVRPGDVLLMGQQLFRIGV